MKPTHECPERRPSTEQISGLIERVTFHSDESGFCVLRVPLENPEGSELTGIMILARPQTVVA